MMNLLPQHKIITTHLANEQVVEGSTPGPDYHNFLRIQANPAVAIKDVFLTSSIFCPLNHFSQCIAVLRYSGKSIGKSIYVFNGSPDGWEKLRLFYHNV